jgi:hypothetical protein
MPLQACTFLNLFCLCLWLLHQVQCVKHGAQHLNSSLRTRHTLVKLAKTQLHYHVMMLCSIAAVMTWPCTCCCRDAATVTQQKPAAGTELHTFALFLSTCYWQHPCDPPSCSIITSTQSPSSMSSCMSRNQHRQQRQQQWQNRLASRI